RDERRAAEDEQKRLGPLDRDLLGGGAELVGRGLELGQMFDHRVVEADLSFLDEQEDGDGRHVLAGRPGRHGGARGLLHSSPSPYPAVWTTSPSLITATLAPASPWRSRQSST